MISIGSPFRKKSVTTLSQKKWKTRSKQRKKCKTPYKTPNKQNYCRFIAWPYLS
jgi:hypothetical protein